MKGNPIGTRWDNEFMKEFTAKTGIKSPQKALNYLCEHWNNSKNNTTTSLDVEKPKKSKSDVQIGTASVNFDINPGRVPFEKEKLFFREKYTLHPESSKPTIPALLTSWKAQKIRSDAKIRKSWEKFQRELYGADFEIFMPRNHSL